VCAEPATLVCVSLKDGAILWTRPNTYVDVLPASEVDKVKADRAKAEELRAQMKPLRDEARRIGADLKKTPDNAELKAKADTLKTRLGELDAELLKSAAYADPPAHEVNGFTSPTPTTDGTLIYGVFGNGVAACYDAEGNRRWARLIEKPTHGWGHSASPLLVDGKLIVHILKVTALDPANGSTLWQTESNPGWGSEVQARIGTTAVVITPSGDFIRASDGRKLAAKVSALTYCAPVVSDGIAYFIQNGGKAVRLPATAGDTITPEVLWQTKPKDDRYYASPVIHDGLVYAVNQTGHWSVIDAADGKVVYDKKLELGGVCYPSVTLAGGLLFVSSDNGKTVVVQPGREYKEVARNVFEPFRSSPVFVGTRAYVRGIEHLWCLGE
jgi:outer membrane protein assembly factor BamB